MQFHHPPPQVNSSWLEAPGRDLDLVCGDLRLSVHRVLMAACSTFMREVLIGEQEKKVLYLVDLEPWEVEQLVECVYTGTTRGLVRGEVEKVLGAARSLGIRGLEVGVINSQRMDVEDDEVFTEEEEEVAVDLSPTNRHPPVSGHQLLVASSKRKTALNKSVLAVNRPPTLSSKPFFSPGSSLDSGFSSKPFLSAGSSVDSRYQSSTSSLGESLASSFKQYRENRAESILNRIKKPKPLTNLTTIDSGHNGNNTIYLKPPKTPRTPLIASPDCQVLEERFRHLIEGTNPTESEKLRNLSVSSADFNFDPGSSSQPGTPFRHRAFHFPPPQEGRQEQGTSLDLSIKKITDSPPLPVPVIKVIKPEPEDDSVSPVPLKEEVEDPLPSPGETFEGYFTFGSPLPQLTSPHLQAAQSPSPSPNVVLTGRQDSARQLLPTPGTDKVHPVPMTTLYIQENSEGTNKKNTKQEGSSNSPTVINKQSFKCQKCGKCYNWNYNLNRHKRFECGIKNRFECSMCEKRFPYKQNAAIHLKRKHKVGLETADEMLSLGHISLLSPDKNNLLKEEEVRLG